MTPLPKLYTVDEYQQVPDPPGGRYELHHGELVFSAWPWRQHGDIQRKLYNVLNPIAEAVGYSVWTSYPYRPLPENELWGADVACIREARHRGVRDWLLGSPELVIEVTAPWNCADELHDKAMTTLVGDGSVEFWIADPEARTVKVFRKTSGVRIYGASDEVPVDLLQYRLPVGSIFAPAD